MLALPAIGDIEAFAFPVLEDGHGRRRWLDSRAGSRLRAPRYVHHRPAYRRGTSVGWHRLGDSTCRSCSYIRLSHACLSTCILQPKFGPAQPPLKVNASTSPSSITIGQSSVLTATVTGGTPWYHYNWTILPVGCANQNRSSLTCEPSEQGVFTVGVTVSDSLGKMANSSTNLTVNGPAPTSSFLGLSAYVLYVFAALVGVVAAVATALVLVRVRRRSPRKPQPLVPSPPTRMFPR